MRPSSLLEQKNNNKHIEDNLKIWLSYFNTCKWFRLGFLCEFSLRGWFRSGWDLGLLEQVPVSAPHFWERSILTSVPPYLSLLETLNPPPLQPLLVQHTNLVPRVFFPLDQWSVNESSGSNHFEMTMEITEFCPSSFTAQSVHLWRMPQMVAPRALIFRPLVKGNKDSGNKIDNIQKPPGHLY